MSNKHRNKAESVRNFCIIAHIDHGKSTLADRILERTGAIKKDGKVAQVLDSMELERERGITIKASAVRSQYKAGDGKTYTLNLIDTPGHVDFSYEVSRSMASCEGALLLVDAAQGLQAQSLANAYLAIEHNLEIIPVINKIDLPSARPDVVLEEIEAALPIRAGEAILTSAKHGTGVQEVLEAVVKRIPPPSGDLAAPAKALVFDSWFDSYRGVIVLVRVFDGQIKPGMMIRFMGEEREFEVGDVGYLMPKMTTNPVLQAGDVGYIVAGIKQITDVRIGDTITGAHNPASEACPGYLEVKPLVFCGLYPTETVQFEALREALSRLRLNDSSFSYEPESSTALGFGFRVGFLGLLHMDIIKERLEREFGLSLICTTPTVTYRVTRESGETVYIQNPNHLSGKILRVEEPLVRAVIYVPVEFVGQMLELCQARRGTQMEFNYVGTERVMLVYELPLAEILYDFLDKLKSMSKGYASLDYEFTGYRESPLVRLDILLNGEPVDALSLIVHNDKAYYKGRQIVEALREVIPRQMFEVAIQAALGNKVIARQSVKAIRKDVTAKCYGGDITRKRKLLEKQKEGKKRMKQVGRVEVPQEAFLTVLGAGDPSK